MPREKPGLVGCSQGFRVDKEMGMCDLADWGSKCAEFKGLVNVSDIGLGCQEPRSPGWTRLTFFFLFNVDVKQKQS